MNAFPSPGKTPAPLLGDVASRFVAPAKVNRFLHVTGRDDDGYHRLQTVFQFLDWGDELQITLRDDSEICITGDLSGLSPAENLVGRAAHLLQQECDVRHGATIAISKRIPPGSGLGGGSSDAATTLLVLNRLWQLHCPIEQLCAWGLKLGADVPVFIAGRACLAEGRGERMRPILADEGPLLLFLPPIHSSTAAVFARPEMVRDSAPLAVAERGRGAVELSGALATAIAAARNDCEAAALAASPALAAVARTLRQYAPFVMSGTGSSFYSRLPSRENMRTIAGLVSSVPGQVVTTSVTNLSPLRMQLGGDATAAG